MVSDKAEDFIVGRMGKFLGVTHKEVERIGKHFDGTRKEFIFVFLLRFLPLIPTAPISIICGIIKIDLKKYLIATFSGLYFRNMIYLYLGYVGYGSISHGFNNAESIVQLLLALLVGGVVAYMFFKRNKVDGIGLLKQKLERKK